MAQKLSTEESKRFFDQLDKDLRYRREVTRRYNYRYHRSAFFIGTFIIRIGSLALMILVFLTFMTTKPPAAEIVSWAIPNDYKSGEHGLKIGTARDNYSTSEPGTERLKITAGDTILVARNIFGVPVKFSKPGWYYSYQLDTLVHFVLFFIPLGFLTFTSLFLTNGLVAFEKNLIAFLSGVDLAALLLFFFL